MTSAPFDVLVDYERRSLAHVAGLPEQLDAPGLWRGVGYRIGARRLASDFGEVLEILPLPQVTPVPGAQSWMLGQAGDMRQAAALVLDQHIERGNAHCRGIHCRRPVHDPSSALIRAINSSSRGGLTM